MLPFHYVTLTYSYVLVRTRMLLVCARMYLHVTRMYSCSVLFTIEQVIAFLQNGRGKVIRTVKRFGEDLNYSPKWSVCEIVNFRPFPKPIRLQDLENSMRHSVSHKV